MKAATHSCLDTLMLLLDYESGIQDPEGQTALMLACVYKADFRIIEKLKKKEIRMVNNNCETALMLALKANNYQAAPLLFDEQGLLNKDGECALVYAIKHCDKLVAKLIDIELQLLRQEDYGLLFIRI